MKKNRLLSLLLALAMLFSVLQTTVFAASSVPSSENEAIAGGTLPVYLAANLDQATADDVETLYTYTGTIVRQAPSKTFANGEYALYSNGQNEIVYSNGTSIVGRKCDNPESDEINYYEIWTLTQVDGGYTFQDRNGQYMRLIPDNTAVSQKTPLNVVKTQSVIHFGENTTKDSSIYLYVNGTDSTEYTLNSFGSGKYGMYNRSQSTGPNNSFYLCKLQKTDNISGYAVKTASIAAAIDGIHDDMRYYTVDTWTAYRTALAAAEGFFTTDEDAKDALNNLKLAVAALESTGFKNAVFNFSKLHNMSWTRTIDVDAGQSLLANVNDWEDGHVFTQEELEAEKNYVGPINYVNHGAKIDAEGVEYPRYTAVTWRWGQLDRLVRDKDVRTTDVWTQNPVNGAYYCKYSTEDVIGGGRHNSDWQNEDFYKISGVFEWPEGYDLFNTNVSLQSINDSDYSAIYDYIADNKSLSDNFDGKVIPVNDDVYVVMWAEVPLENGEKETKPLTEQDMDDHLMFWTGTTSKGIWTNNGMAGNDWSRTTPATFLSAMKQGVRAFYRSYPNLVGVDPELTNANVVNKQVVANMMSHTDGWYTITDVSAINSVLRNNYPNGIPAQTRVHLDLYLGNNASFGMIDELEIELTTIEDTNADVRVEYYLDAVNENGYLGTTYILDVPFGKEITLLSGTKANQLNHLHAAAINKAVQRDVTNGIQLGSTPYIVERDKDNVIYVLYTRKNTKTVVLTAETKTVEFNNENHTADQVTVDEISEATGGVRQPDGYYLLPDGNFLWVYDSNSNLVTGSPASVTERLPGSYSNPFEGLTYQVTNPDGDNVTNTYTFVEIPGCLTITYTPAPAEVVYDFGIENEYKVFDQNPVEQYATITVPEITDGDLSIYGSPRAITDTEGNGTYQTLVYTPSTVNLGVEANATLTFTGNYTVKKNIKIYPASNVWYDVNMFDNSAENNQWEEVTEGLQDRNNVVSDNDLVGNSGLIHGYTTANLSTKFGNDHALRATLTKGAITKPITATFTGTGFDLIANCGNDTGILMVALKNADTMATIKVFMVDTYYSEDHGANQVPVIREMNMPYGNYFLDIRGYLGASAGALLPATTNSRSAQILTTSASDNLVHAALAEAGWADVEDVEVIYMDNASVLNRNQDTVVKSTVMAVGSDIRTMGYAAQTVPMADKDVKVYVNGFRVYQPLVNNEPTIYTTEKEAGTTYINAYDFVAVSTNDLPEEIPQGFLYVEYEGGYTDRGTIADYKNQGPHNELYLKANNAIAFVLKGYTSDKTIHVSAKAVTGDAKLNGQDVNGTEMYYDVEPISTVLDGEDVYYVLLKNDGADGSMLAISAVKYSVGISTYGDIGLAVTLKGETQGEPTAFTPNVSISARTVGKSTALSITAEKTVYRLLITGLDKNGNEIVATQTLKPTNEKAVERGKVQDYTFSYTIKLNTVTAVKIVAVDKNGNESAPVWCPLSNDNGGKKK